MELGLNDKLHHMEEVINKLFMALLSTKDYRSNTNAYSGLLRHNKEEFTEFAEGGRQMFSSKLIKLEFPRYSDQLIVKILMKRYQELQGHKCRGPQLLLLEGSYNSNDEEEANKETIIEPKISSHALTGWTTSKTMRVLARIGPCKVAILINSGSTHNFISEKIANLLQLAVVPTRPFNVKVANGNPLKCEGRFELVSILLQGIPFSLLSIPCH
uniref:Uncharacterized protein n=1 Tax=Populus alba TaxID=43335 RepID=A0A4V6A9P7_POPAL|nr:hypothetical protein D5086_0000109460 [Populus alba]